jgi:hypothetical protein
MKRRSFFLLEVLIAAILVGGFAYLSIHGAFRVIYKQRKLLNEIENSIEADRKRMKVLEKYWSKVETLLDPKGIKEEGFKVTCTRVDHVNKEKYYLLKLNDGKETYCYCVAKQAL